MAQSRESSDQSIRYEWLAAVLLAVLALAAFALQARALSPSTTALDTVLFNSLQFLLTIGFAWFSTRAVTRAEFERSMKKFAIGAYRRIRDIESMAAGLHDKIASMRSNRAPEACQELDIVDAIVENTIQVIRSSIADWSDVIGDELTKIDTIDKLKQERADLRSQPPSAELPMDLEDRIRQIDERISALTKALPAKLTVASPKEFGDSRARSFRAEWMAERHKSERDETAHCRGWAVQAYSRS